PRFFNHGNYPAIGVSEVEGRTNILIHKGNRASDVSGCIVIGTELGVLQGELAVMKSAEAWALFFGRYGYDEFDLVIEPVHPLSGARV
ncbi:MAG: DUF5675 family protein, partial [Thermoanaerobaculia bacterium]